MKLRECLLPQLYLECGGESAVLVLDAPVGQEEPGGLGAASAVEVCELDTGRHGAGCWTLSSDDWSSSQRDAALYPNTVDSGSHTVHIYSLLS